MCIWNATAMYHENVCDHWKGKKPRGSPGSDEPVEFPINKAQESMKIEIQMTHSDRCQNLR